MQVVNYQSKQVVVREGDPSNFIHIIISGTFEMFIKRALHHQND